MRVGGVIPGSMADAAEIAVGDVVESLCDVRLDSLDALQHAARRAGAIAIAKAEIVREGERSERSMIVQRRPLETSVEYGEIERGGIRLRTLVTKPHAMPAPGVLFIQGFSRESIDFATANVAPIRELVHGWTREGFVTMRVDKRGVGDSEGEAADFRTEIEDFRAALGVLRETCGSVFIFGHSLGGMIAPLLAEDARGIMVYGTSPVPWYECVRRSRDRQRALRKLAPLKVPVVRTAYETEIHESDLAAAWKSVTAPVLVLHGEYDWVVGEDEARAIGEVTIVPGLDHWMTRHASLEDSLRNAGAGSMDRAILDLATSFMKRALSR